MNYDAIIVGGGMAGLTAAAYLSKAGYPTLLCEKESACGGLVNSFERDGFVYDGGIRAMENSGVLFPMLRHLGLEVEFVQNHISIGIEERVIRVNSEENLTDYQDLLSELYPDSRAEIDANRRPNPADHALHEGAIWHQQPDLLGYEEGSGLHGQGGPALDGAVCPDRAKDQRVE